MILVIQSDHKFAGTCNSVSRGLNFHYWCAVCGVCKWSGILLVFVCSHIILSLLSLGKVSESIDLLNASFVHAPEFVSMMKPILSIIIYSIYGAVCYQLTQFSCDYCETVHIKSLSSLKKEIWIIKHCLCSGHETMICAVCLTIFLLYWSPISHSYYWTFDNRCYSITEIAAPFP